MPSTAQAAIVFLVIVLPGFLAQSGYRAGRAVPEHQQGLVAVARVIAVSTVLILAAWKLGGRSVYDYAREGTALTLHNAYTWRFAVMLVLVPPLLGYIAGQAVDACARIIGDAIDGLPHSATSEKRPGERVRRRLLKALSGRLLHEGPTIMGSNVASPPTHRAVFLRKDHDHRRTGDHWSGGGRISRRTLATTARRVSRGGPPPSRGWQLLSHRIRTRGLHRWR